VHNSLYFSIKATFQASEPLILNSICSYGGQAIIYNGCPKKKKEP